MPRHRCALVGVGRARLAARLSARPGRPPQARDDLSEERAAVERELESTRFVGSVTRVVAYPGLFPVDRRHNAKIHREELAAWAAENVPA